MEEKKVYRCHYCYFTSKDLDEVKKHEEYLHGCFRDINPRRKKSINKKEIVDQIICARHLPIKGSDFKIDVMYEIYSDGSYRMFTDDLKYGYHQEIIEENGRYTIKNLDKLRAEWNRTHGKKVSRKDSVLERFCDEV